MAKSLGFLIKHILKRRWLFLLTSLSLVAIVLLNIYGAKILARLIDVSTALDKSSSLNFALTYFMVIIVIAVLTYLNTYSAKVLGAKCMEDIRSSATERLVDCGYESLTSLRAGDMLTTINSDVSTASEFISGDMCSLALQFTMALATFIYMLTIDWRLCLITFAYTPFGMFFTTRLNKKMNTLYPVGAELRADAMSALEQSLTCVPVIKTFLINRRVNKMMRDKFELLNKNEVDIQFYNAFMQPACHTTSWIPNALMLAFGGFMVSRGDITVGTLIALQSISTNIVGPSVYFPFLINGLNRSIASIGRIARLNELKDAKRKPTETEFLDVRNLSYSYDGIRYAVDGFSLSIDKPGLTVLRGLSGGGKSTILESIGGVLGFWRGDIAVSPDSVLISQNAPVPTGSVMDLIKQLSPDASDEQAVSAAIECGADSVINALPDGYNTIVGDGAHALSGGEAQIIAIASLGLSGANVILMDEATSALDEATEKTVLKFIKRLSLSKVIVASAHRDMWFSSADTVIEVEARNA